MLRIGVRELRQNASRYLDQVASGQTVEVTQRGRLVARIVPAGGDVWADLISSGDRRYGFYRRVGPHRVGSRGGADRFVRRGGASPAGIDPPQRGGTDEPAIGPAAMLPPTGLRTPDAIHLAAAATATDLRAVVTYDSRMSDATGRLGLAIAEPR